MSSSAVKLFIFISCFLVLVRIISGVASPVKTWRRKLEETSDKLYDLDMAPNSVDDQFIGCEHEARDLVEKTFLQQELNFNPEFKKIWEHNWWLHIFDRAIRVYTDDSNVHKDLNDETISYRNKFCFRFKALHFLLTCAIQEHKIKQCQTVFRRTKASFKPIDYNREIRFGRFASASVYHNLVQFGKTSCFKIRTCYGADIANISYYKNEGEVLIPPYEKFIITDIQDQNNEMECEVLYILESAGTCSNMNCEMLKTNMKHVDK